MPLSSFNRSLMLGFDELEKMLTQVAKSGESFPPYNVEQMGPTDLLISLAVAGYTESDLEVVVDGTQLIVRGRQDQQHEHTYLHKGIAARSFLKSFVLAEGMKVSSTVLEYGLLKIFLNRPEKKSKRISIPITSKGANHPKVLEVKKKK